MVNQFAGWDVNINIANYKRKRRKIHFKKEKCLGVVGGGGGGCGKQGRNKSAKNLQAQGMNVSVNRLKSRKKNKYI